jgi:hypothetical protein
MQETFKRHDTNQEGKSIIHVQNLTLEYEKVHTGK